MEQWWNSDRQEKFEETGEKPAPVPLHPPTLCNLGLNTTQHNTPWQ